MADNNTILEKLEGLVARFEEVSTLITDPAVIADQKRYVKLTKEYKELGDLMEARKEYIQVLNGIEEAKEIISNEADPEMREMAREELMPVRHASRNWKSISNSSSYLPTHRTARTPSSKFVEVQAVTKPLSLPETFSACTPNIAKQKVGGWKYPASTKARQVDSRKLFAALRATMCTEH